MEGISVKALVDTGAAVSVVRSDLCRRLRKVTTPFSGYTLLTAGKQNLIPTAKCTARICIDQIIHVVELVVLPSCSHEIILGWDFLTLADACIDCSYGEVELSEVGPSDVCELPPDAKLSLFEDTVIPPCSSVIMSVTSPDCVNCTALISPSQANFLKSGIVVPHCVTTFVNGFASLVGTNPSSTSLFLPQGSTLGIVSVYDECELMSLDTPSPNPTQITCRSPGQSLHPLLADSLDANLEVSKKESLLALLQHYAHCFDVNSPSLGRVTSTEHNINVGDSLPLRQRPYRVSSAERNLIDEQVNEMLEKGVIRPSCSSWASPVVLVKKKDGTVRFCIDFRRLNKITQKDVYPMPRIDDALDCLQGSNYFSSIDLRSGYWQVPMAESSKDKTAFATPDGLFEYNVMPFGLCNAPATFERMMDNVLRGLKWKVCLRYLDDVVVFSQTFEEHLRRLDNILSALSKAGLQLNTKKCRFASRSIRVLGHIVSKEGIQPDPDKIRAVSHFPHPQSVKDVRSFLGLCSYFRRFVRGFACLAEPLYRLLNKNTTFSWSSECEQSFDKLKHLLTSDPILRHFDSSAPIELHTDASGFGLGAVLTQKKEGYTSYVVAYASRTLTKAERNYSTTEKEGLAIVWAIGKFRPYLYGRHFVVVTDHHALCWLASLKDPSGRLGRWTLRLQEFDYTVRYKSGKKHGDADGLSRCPLPEESPNTLFDEDPLCLQSLSLTNMARDQASDPRITQIINHLNGSQISMDRTFSRKVRHFCLRDSLVYRRSYLPHGQRWLLYIPQHLRGEVLNSMHSDATCGHAGFAKTYTRISQRYFWPGLYRSVQRYVQACAECQRRKRPTQAPSGLLQPLPCPSRPFERVGIDLIGPLHTSSSGNRWVVVAIDHLTRYAETSALPTATAEDVATFFLTNILLRHGAPHTLLSDRGRVFLSALVQGLLAACNTIHSTTTAYHPQTNGLTERLNRTLLDMLAMYTDANQTNWDKVLPFITFAYNTSIQATTNFSPFFLLFGREASVTLDTILPYRSDATENQTLSEMASYAEECRQIARLRTINSQAEQKRRYDSRHQPNRFNPGDLVWLWIPQRQVGLSEKLLYKYDGPYRVISQTSPVNYVIEALEVPVDHRHRYRDTVHVARLKKYYPPIAAL